MTPFLEGDGNTLKASVLKDSVQNLLFGMPEKRAQLS